MSHVEWGIAGEALSHASSSRSPCSSRHRYGNPARAFLAVMGLFWVFFFLASKLTNHSFLCGDQVILLGPVWAGD